MLVTAHAAEDDDCLDCHDPSLGEQLGEAAAWISGNFKDPISPGLEYEDDFCLNAECHDISREELSNVSEDWTWNVHENRHGDIACSTCHEMHGTSKLYCASCHEEAQEFADELGWEYTPA